MNLRHPLINDPWPVLLHAKNGNVLTNIRFRKKASKVLYLRKKEYMKLFVFRFFEEPVAEDTALKDIAYSDRLNLNIVFSTGKPAIGSVSLDTDTFTKAAVDTNEHDHQFTSVLHKYLDTQLQTRASLDQTESDYPQ